MTVMPSGLRVIIAEIEGKLGDEATDPADEHARWNLYVRAAEVEHCWPQLREAIALEEDRAVASSLVVRMLERVPAEEREDWSCLLPAEEDRDFALRRARELNFLEAVLLGSPEEERGDLRFETWSPWLQLRLAGSSEDRDILALLAESGATRRIRAGAAARRRSLGDTEKH
ncbi:hypothetical protein ORV05_22905 [Amycolatopsis cynarae]|uniref:Uncharacterized protein n=1 Tax=Amycolatopsis cynarae TaxID=2995223 RepID=A0ABY7AVW4_9PSEU|nr:hypothetical protein [Amycolatopsis sp. HUAS 11-8]WAL63830.1 hypothetical protein ORV05_22905 [Amycolatopsis sp. HUAS 11-8]